jgi:hypothetical protein
VNQPRRLLLLLPGLLVLGLPACGGTGPDDNPVVDCSEVDPTSLGVGAHAIIDAAQFGCVRVPAAGPGGAEYLYVALSGSGTVDSNGVFEEYQLVGSSPAAAAVSSRRAAPRPSVSLALKGPVRNFAFDARLRARERSLTARPGAASFARARAQQATVAPPVPGEQRTFKVCETPECDTFVDAVATAQVVTDGVAIFLDNNPPAGGYTPADLVAVGDLFDQQLYPIDTTAFGRESDIDGDGVVIVLLTPRINDLSPTCETDGNVILGYFFGLDLLPQLANSNAGEIFYGAVPDPSRPDCFGKDFITGHLSPLFIHEFQHMISFNQHVLERDGQAEQTWLNEGLSHFAEELGGRLVPDAECQPNFDSCETQFLVTGDLNNAFDYLLEPDSSFLIEPGNSGGTLAERGANWLFVRWLADHFAATQPQGTELTRQLVQTNRLGSANVSAVTGRPFDELVSLWQLANYVDDLPGFTPADSRLQYLSWNFRNVFTTYPLEPEVAPDGVINQAGILRGGSGNHVLIVQQPNAPEVGFKLTQRNGTSALPETVAPRAVLLRIR